jgi:hypothetical protein
MYIPLSSKDGIGSRCSAVRASERVAMSFESRYRVLMSCRRRSSNDNAKLLGCCDARALTPALRHAHANAPPHHTTNNRELVSS